MRNALFLSFLFMPICVLAQISESYSIDGSVIYGNGNKSSFIIVSLYNSIDSSRLLSTVSDSAGKFHFKNVPKGKYLIGLQYAKNKTKLLSQQYTISSSFKNIRIILDEPVNTLDEVIITGKNPFLKRESDRLVIDPESSTLTKGQTLLQVLPKLPGIDIISGKSITVNGSGDVLLIIDGKSYKTMSSQALQLLNSLRSDNVDKIEIYTTPPARFEAEGSSVINVILKKDKIFSNVYFTYDQLFYPVRNEPGWNFNQFSGGGNFFYSIGNLRLNGRMSISDNSKNYGREEYGSNFSEGNRQNKTFSTATAKDLFANLTANYAVKQHTMGLSVGTNNTLMTNIRLTTEDIFFNKNNNIDSSFTSDINTKISNSNPVIMLYYDNLINKAKNQSISIALIAGEYKNNYDIAQYIAQTTNSTTAFISQDQDFSIKSRAFKIDYTQNHKILGKIETGIKFTRINNSDEYSYVADLPVLFKFREEIQAFYLAAGKTINKAFSYTAGIRIERTVNNATSTSLPDKIVERDYITIFPTFSIQHKINEKSNLSFSYSRRIARPSYSNFNPASFLIFNDAFAGQSGNIYLQPQYISKYEFSIKRSNLYTSVTYTHKRNIRTVVAEEVKPFIISYKTINVSGSNIYTLINYRFHPNKWFETIFEASGQYNSYRLLNNVHNESFAWKLSNLMSFNLLPSLAANVSIKYYSPLQIDYSKFTGYYFIEAGVSKSFFQEKVNVNLSIYDLTGSKRPALIYNYPAFEKTVYALSNERQFKINISYKFKTGNKFLLKRKQADEFGETRFYK